jgi:hypothetical protein
MVREELINQLKEELKQVRHLSLAASRKGDFMRVARCTSQAAQLNRAIMEAENQLEADRTGANHRDARRG